MTPEELLKKNIIELRDMAKAAGIKRIPTYKKTELAQLLASMDKAIKPKENTIVAPNAQESTPVIQKPRRGRPPKTKDQAPSDKAVSDHADNTQSNTTQQIDKPQDEVSAPVKRGRGRPPKKATPILDPAKAEARVDESVVLNANEPVDNKGAEPTDEQSKPTDSSATSDARPTHGEYIPHNVRKPLPEQNGYAQRRPLQRGQYAPKSYAPNHNNNNHPYVNRDNAPKADMRIPDPELLATCRQASGILEILTDGYGFLRVENYYSGPNDIYISPAQIRRFSLRNGDFVSGRARKQREGDRFEALMSVDEVNGEAPFDGMRRCRFEDLTPIFPNERYTLEVAGKPNSVAVRLIDLIAPIGKGQRAMIVSQPKAGKTTLLKQIANGISTNYPDAHLIVLLVDERPEEVTDMKRSIRGEVVYSTFDELPEHHTRIAEMVQERAIRLVEQGKDVVILLDSLTRLTRAYNLVIPPTGRTLSGGMDPGALHKPKRFFGSARNIEGGGSLTVIATALVETGSRMDDIVYEEFKGTGNMEIHLDRRLAEKRVFPAIDIYKSSTRREDLLLSKKELEGVYMLRKMLAGGASADLTEQYISMLEKTSNNEDFLQRLKEWIMIYEKKGYTAGSNQNRYGQ